MQTVGLTIGQRIRMVRKYLGVKQYEITSGKITRNLISAIENDKVRLTPENARLIYDNLNRFAKEKNLDIDLDLSEILGSEPDFQAELQADHYIDQLKRSIRTHNIPTYEKIHEIEDFLYAWDIPVKKAEVYSLFAEIYGLKNDRLKELFYYTKAFELYSVEKYFNSLPRIASRITECSDTLNSPEIGMRFCELAISKEPTASRRDMYTLYMKSALSNSKLGNHDRAIKNIDVCIDRYTDDLGADYYQAVQAKAKCHSENLCLMEAIQYYTHATNGFYRLDYIREGIESTIPVITLLYTQDKESNATRIHTLIQELNNKLKELQSVPVPLQMHLAEMYTQLNLSDNALSIYNTVLGDQEILSSDEKVNVLHASFNLYKITHHMSKWLGYYKAAHLELKKLNNTQQRQLATCLTHSLKYLIETQNFDFAKQITHDLAALAQTVKS